LNTASRDKMGELPISTLIRPHNQKKKSKKLAQWHAAIIPALGKLRHV
jgi:hypothetical protein